MAQTFKSKTLLGRSGIFSHQTIAPNLIYNTGNQIISGVKTFAENTTFGDSAQGDFLVISGNQFTVYGSGNFTSGLFVNGNAVLTGIDLTSYATKINLASTGSTLNSNINSLSGLFTGYTGNLDTTYASDIQLATTGSTLDSKINNASGYFTGTNATFTTNLASTGSTLDTKINNLSGYVTGAHATFASITNLASTGSTLDAKINNLSGVSVLTFGNQTINGIKTFAQTGSFDTVQITNKKLSSYNYVNSNFTFGDIYINIANSSNNITGTLPSGITSGINYYVKNLNTGILLITGSGQRTIDGFSTVNLYRNESLQLLGVNNIGYTGWITLSADNGVS